MCSCSDLTQKFHSISGPMQFTMRFELLNRRTGDRRHAADTRCARRKGRSWDKATITLPRRRTIGVRCRVTGHARTRKGIDVGVRSRKSVRECLKEGNDLVLLLISQAEITGGHVDIVLDLGHRPAGHFLDRSGRAVSGSDRERKLVARVVKVYELLQALEIAVVKEPLLEIRSRAGFGGGTIWRCHGHIARTRYLHLAVDTLRELCPIRVRVGPRSQAASEEGSSSQISV